jgi:adenylate cyclase
MVSGKQQGKVYPVFPMTTIGREVGNTVQILDGKVSRFHAVLRREKDRYILEDQNSSNGTFVNSELIVTRTIKNNDHLRFGDTTCRFLNAQNGSPGAPRAQVQFIPKKEAEVVGAEINLDRTSHMQLQLAQKDLKETKEAYENLKVLYRLSDSLAGMSDLHELLESLLASIFEVFPVDRGAILLKDPDSGELVPRATRSRESRAKDASIVISRSIVGHVEEKRTALFLVDTSDDESFKPGGSVFDHAIHSAICVPLLAETELIGIIYLDSRSGKAFSKREFELITEVSKRAAGIIDRWEDKRCEQEAMARRNRLKSFLAPELVDQILTEKIVFPDVGQRKKATVLFAELRRLEPLSETADPETVIDLLNEYYEMASDAIFKYQGTLETIAGNTIMAVWGAPFNTQFDSLHAAKAAIELQVALYHFNYRLEGRERPPLSMAIGIHTGELIAGNLGFPKRRLYTVSGYPVFIASQLVSMVEDDQILITDSTYREIRRFIKAEKLNPADFQELGRKYSVFQILGAYAEKEVGEITRRHHRIAVSLPITCTVKRSGEIHRGVIKEISLGGVSMDMEKEPDMSFQHGEELLLSFHDRSGLSVDDLSGKIVRINYACDTSSSIYYNMGIQFISPSDGHKEILRNMISRAAG